MMRYLFDPRPVQLPYTDSAIIAGLVLVVALFLSAYLIGRWRRRTDAVARKLSKPWAAVSVWAGLLALVLVLARAEDIQIFSMRFMWVLWGVLVLLFVLLQIRSFRRRHYAVVKMPVFHDPRDAYLPKKKKR